MIGLIVKKQPTLFEIYVEGNVYSCQARGNLKKEGLFVGDKVEFDEKNLVIEKIIPRKNKLIRPPMVNLDKMFITIASKPQPDLYLVDKLLLFCRLNNIKPIICVNKVDEDEALLNKVKEIYKNNFEIIGCSAKLNLVEELKSQIEGVCAFAGQSAVGKSSLINSIFGKSLEEVGDFGKKIERGKQTTRVVTLYPCEKGFIADTAGFSQLDERLLDVDYKELGRYFPDFYPYINECKYQTCDHKNSIECKVKQAVKEGKIAKERYENYLKLLEIKKQEIKY